MKCTQCGTRLLRVSQSHESHVGTTKVEAVDRWACINKTCSMYANDDLSNPTTVVKRESEKLQSVIYLESHGSDNKVNNQTIETIEFIDTKNNKVLGLYSNDNQACDEGYKFKITFKENN